MEPAAMGKGKGVKGSQVTDLKNGARPPSSRQQTVTDRSAGARHRGVWVYREQTRQSTQASREGGLRGPLDTVNMQREVNGRG